MEYRLYQRHHVIARKTLQCDNCAQSIRKGDKYERDIFWCVMGGHSMCRYCWACRSDERPPHWGSFISEELHSY